MCQVTPAYVSRQRIQPEDASLQLDTVMLSCWHFGSVYLQFNLHRPGRTASLTVTVARVHSFWAICNSFLGHAGCQSGPKWLQNRLERQVGAPQMVPAHALKVSFLVHFSISKRLSFKGVWDMGCQNDPNRLQKWAENTCFGTLSGPGLLL